MPNLGSNHERSEAYRGSKLSWKLDQLFQPWSTTRLGRLSQAGLHRLARHPNDAQYNPRGINIV